MKHREMDDQEVVERYVRNQLSADERRAFQEHFLTCDQCFDQVQMTERFIIGVRHAADSGLLNYAANEDVFAVSPFWLRWLRPALALTSVAFLGLAAVLLWLLLVRVPRLQEEIVRERGVREQVEQQKQREIAELNERLERQRLLPDQSAKVVAPNRNSASTNSSESLAANIPLVVLQATRDVLESNELKLLRGAERFRLRFELGPQTEFRTFRIEILTSEGRLAKSINGVERNSRNSISVTLAAHSFPTGVYLVKLFGVNHTRQALVAEYKLRLERD